MTAHAASGGNSNASGTSSLRPPIPTRQLPVRGGAQALFKTTDGGKTWKELSRIAPRKSHGSWQPVTSGRHGRSHTILLDPRKNDQRIYVAISAGGCFRTDDGGKTWKPITKGIEVAFTNCPIPTCGSRSLRASHRAAIRPSRTCCSCKNIGMCCAVTTRREISGTKSAAICRAILASRLM